MHALTCPICNGLSGFDHRECPFCGTPVGVHLPSRSLVVASDEGVEIGGRRWVTCSNRADTGCNWMTLAEVDDASLGLRGRCFPGSLVRNRPDAGDTIALEKLRSATFDLRMLIYQLVDLGLPVEPFWRSDGGLAFDLLSSQTLGRPVTIGHANGVITIDLAETQDAGLRGMLRALPAHHRNHRHRTGIRPHAGERSGALLDGPRHRAAGILRRSAHRTSAV